MSVDDATRARAAMRLYGRQSRVRARRRRVLTSLGVVVALAAIPFAHLVMQRGAVVHGVRVAGVPLGGSSRAAAEREISAAVGDQLQRDVTVTVAGREATLSPYDLGVRVDAARTASAALAAGRVRGGLLFSFGYSHSIAPVLRYPDRLALPVELANVTQPPVDARLVLKPSGAAIAIPAKPGVGFDPAAALRTITRAALASKTSVSLRTVPTPAAISTAAARRAKARVALFLSEPISFTRRGQGAGLWPVRRLSPLLTATTYKHVIGVQFDPQKVGAALRPPLSESLRPAKDAQWKVVGDRARVLSSLSGIDLDAHTTARHLTHAGLQSGSARVAALAFRVTQPELTTSQARALGATTVVSRQTTSLGDSSPNRIFNVALLAKLLDGAIVKPGATFSFNTVVGPRTAERGFREGQAIENGVLVPSIGGGVCQAATTVFDAAFAGGYDITYRVNHSFYISHYPLGMDATVADTGPDVTFVNDTANAIVIKATASPATMTVVFLSRPLDRHVEDATSTPTAYVEPKKRYYASPDVPAGTVSQTTLGERGFQVTVSRTVRDAKGKLLHDDSFRSRYIPEDAIYLIGKGGKLPAGQTLSGLYPGYTGSTAGIDLSTWLAKPAKKKKPAKKANPADGTTTGTYGATPGTTTGTTGTTPVDPASTTPTDVTTAPTGQ
jgi:vancomycin resistance protein YoaR